MGGNLSGFWPNVSGRVVKTAFYVAMETFWGKYFFRKSKSFLQPFPNKEREFSAFGWIIRLGCQYCILINHSIILMIGNFFIKGLFNFFSFSCNERNFLSFWQVSTLWLSKQFSTCPQELLRKIFFRKKKFVSNLVISIKSNIFHLCGEIIQRGCQNSILFNHGNTLRKNNFWLNCFFIYHFRTLMETFWLSDKIFLLWWSKLNSKCPQEHCEEVYLLLKKVFALLYFFQRISGHFWPSGKGSEHGCQNCLRRVHKDTLRDFFLNKNFCLF